MSQRKALVQRYLDGFRRSDHGLILSCLTDDVVWDLPGHRHLTARSYLVPLTAPDAPDPVSPAGSG
jgi:ketosteroid isomerase-like protein